MRLLVRGLWLARGLLLAGTAAPAIAADIDNSWLRGSSSFPADPPAYRRWGGAYGGGQVGADFYGTDFRGLTQSAIAIISKLDANFTGIPLSNFPQLTAINSKGLSYGGFAGYNYQIDDIVLGLELNFNRAALNAGISDKQSHDYVVNANNSVYAATYNVTTSASIASAEYGTIRARGGWAFGNFLPYVFAGISVGQVNTSTSVNVNYSSTLVSGPGPLIGGNWTQSANDHGKWGYGFDAGLGLDYAVTRNIFLRGEAEYTQLSDQNSIKASAASVRAGAGVRF